MGWNEGFRLMEYNVILLYDYKILTPELLDAVMEPYKNTDCDSGGSEDLKTKDGHSVQEVICMTMEPEAYQDAINNPVWYEDDEELPEPDTPDYMRNKKFWDLYYKIWNERWGIF